MVIKMDEAIQDIVYLGNRLKGVLALIPFLEKVGTIENAIKEREQFLADRTKERDEVLSDVQAAKDEYNIVIAESADREEEAVKYTDALMKETQDKVKKLLQDTKDENDTMVAKGVFELGQVLLQIQNATDKLNDVTQQTNEIEAKKQILLSDIAQLKSRF